MLISIDRKSLDEVLADIGITKLLIFGQQDQKAGVVYGIALEAISTDPFRKVSLIQNIDLLTETEKADWHAENDNYVALSKKKEVVEFGNVSSLCTKTGKPAPTKIEDVFYRARK